VDKVAEQYRSPSHRVSVPGRKEVAEEPNPVGGRGKILPIDNGPSIYVGGLCYPFALLFVARLLPFFV